ncbi:MAG: hypothetical protein U5K55_14010 [Aliarcobacter sp.]|nr:hypothetical protein [Aliarcobacter sp.]
MITDIEKIEVVKGAQSGIWGADASGWSYKYYYKSATKIGLHGNAYYRSMVTFNTKKYGMSMYLIKLDRF